MAILHNRIIPYAAVKNYSPGHSEIKSSHSLVQLLRGVEILSLSPSVDHVVYVRHPTQTLQPVRFVISYGTIFIQCVCE